MAAFACVYGGLWLSPNTPGNQLSQQTQTKARDTHVKFCLINELPLLVSVAIGWLLFSLIKDVESVSEK